MRICGKPTILAVAGLCLCGLFSQTALAQSIVESGTSILAPSTPPVGGIVSASQEYVTVSWSVVLDAGIYTYNYTVNNPAGDVLLNNDGTLTSNPEIVDAFNVAFNAAAAGAYINGTASGGLAAFSTGIDGMNWFLVPVSAGSSSPLLSYESYLPPTLGNGNAQDSDPPSPWASTSPNGQQVPVPNTAAIITPEPATIGLLCLGGSLLLPYRSAFRRRK